MPSILRYEDESEINKLHIPDADDHSGSRS
jgi:hypothetical protein